TSYSTQTDANGRFRINAQRGSTLRFTNVGYRSKDVVVGTGNEIVVSLEAQEAAIEEVLVTAEFGVKRTGRAVGSSVQQIDGATISESGRENFISALAGRVPRSEEHTSELQSRENLVCRLLLEKEKILI